MLMREKQKTKITQRPLVSTCGVQRYNVTVRLLKQKPLKNHSILLQNL